VAGTFSGETCLTGWKCCSVVQTVRLSSVLENKGKRSAGRPLAGRRTARATPAPGPSASGSGRTGITRRQGNCRWSSMAAKSRGPRAGSDRVDTRMPEQTEKNTASPFPARASRAERRQSASAGQGARRPRTPHSALRAGRADRRRSAPGSSTSSTRADEPHRVLDLPAGPRRSGNHCGGAQVNHSRATAAGLPAALPAVQQFAKLRGVFCA
jgi:hypothetical protein